MPEEKCHIQVPMLLVTCKSDYIAVPMIQEGLMRLWVRDLVVREMDSRQVMLSAKPGWGGGVNRTLEEFSDK